MALQSIVGPWPHFQFLDPIYSRQDSFLGRGISPPQGLYLHTGKHKQNNRTQTSMPPVGFEPTIPVFARAKTVSSLDRVASVIGQEKLHLVFVLSTEYVRINCFGRCWPYCCEYPLIPTVILRQRVLSIVRYLVNELTAVCEIQIIAERNTSPDADGGNCYKLT
jgi:hypothetical protein